jgi:sarcosine oxidase subunit alpha
MFRRTGTLRDPVTLSLDGSPIQAERGEPIAIALLANDTFILARSPKLHRPHAPSCLRGGCDGCLMRVCGTPNVMTCLVPAAGDEQVETQNVIGARQADLLRVTDWFFPKGIDHHHLMAGVPGLGAVMQTFARKVAGLGRMPAEGEPTREARRVDADAAVVGGGVAGIAIAKRLSSKGASVVLVDDGLALGAALGPTELGAAGVQVFSRATAAGVYLGELLIASAEEAVVVRAKAKIFATGAHDGMLAFPGNDMPGVFSARALCVLAARGVVPDGPVVLAGEGFWADELARRLGSDAVVRITVESIAGVEGTAGVKRVLVRSKDGEATIKAEILALALPGAPAFEVAAQAGAEVRYVPDRGYAVVCDEHGRAGAGLWAAGECTGKAFDPAAIEAEAVRIADDVLADLGR